MGAPLPKAEVRSVGADVKCDRARCGTVLASLTVGQVHGQAGGQAAAAW
jgi:hypothetical protein